MGVRSSFKTAAGSKPLQGNRELSILYDFSVAASFNEDLSVEQQLGEIDVVQSCFIDNVDNASTLVLTIGPGGLSQRIVCPALSQGIFPILAPGKFTATVACAGGKAARVIYSNTKREFKVWGPVTVTVNVAQLVATFLPTILPVTQTKLVLNGASQILLAANPARARLRIVPAANNAGPLAYNYAAAAVLANNINLAPGVPFDSGTGPVSGQQVQVIGTNGDAVFVEES